MRTGALTIYRVSGTQSCLLWLRGERSSCRPYHAEPMKGLPVDLVSAAEFLAG